MANQTQQNNEVLLELRAFREEMRGEREERRAQIQQQNDIVIPVEAFQSRMDAFKDHFDAKVSVIATEIKAGQYENTAEVEGGIHRIYACISSGFKDLNEIAEKAPFAKEPNTEQLTDVVKAAVLDAFSQHKDTAIFVNRDNGNSSDSTVCAELNKKITQLQDALNTKFESDTINLLTAYYKQQENKFQKQIAGNLTSLGFAKAKLKDTEADLKDAEKEIEIMKNQIAFHSDSSDDSDNSDNRDNRDNTRADPAELLQMELEMKEMEDRHNEQMRIVNEQYRHLFNQYADSKGNIRVLVRIRPGAPGEELINVTNPNEGSFLPWSSLRITTEEQQVSHHGPRLDVKTYEGFQRVFGPSETNQDVFDEIADMAQSAVYGKPCTVLGYGQTGSGKTHTFLADDGIVPRYFELIFGLSESQSNPDYSLEFQLSAAEIYINKIRDLLHDSSLESQKTKKVEKVIISDWARRTERNVDSLEVARSYLATILRQRQTAATKGNAASSRSHLVLSLRIRRVSKKEDVKDSDSVINFVDLAGSEAPGKNNSQGTEFEEGTDINTSLTELGSSVRMMRDGQKIIGSHNLIKVLRNTLTGGSRLLMMFMVSPLMVNLASTKNTLTKASEATGTTVSTAAPSSARRAPSTPSQRPQTSSTPSRKPQAPSRPSRKPRTSSTKTPPSNASGGNR
ncbi:P-loop containing nucleoside triphosphate hydrolase protein [Xylariaceae sp. FL1272]|nr:P-loop containing nucleoside triphosphate hydrolase protein [Xylariaceae sp. FL1272]